MKTKKCIYFSGIMSKTCDAGVVYDEVDRDNRLPYRAGLPCVIIKEDAAVKKSACSLCRYPSDEEIAEQRAKALEYGRNMELALRAVEPVRKEHKGNNWQGTIECPVCHGRLWVSHHGCNNHIWAKCLDKHCVQWME